MLLACTYMYGQLSAFSSASTSVDIIVPVGAEKKGELIVKGFYPGKELSIIELNRSGILINGRLGLPELQDKITFPTFQILGGQYTYSITFTYDPVIINRNAVHETLFIESLSILPANEIGTEQTTSERFSIGAKLRVGPSQIPGNYFSPNPYTVTIHFN